MSSTPPLLLADLLTSSFPRSPLCPRSPQLSQLSPLIVQNPEVDSLWHETLFDANIFLSKPEPEGIPPYFLDGEAVDHHSVSPPRPFRLTLADPCSCQIYDHHTPPTIFPPYYLSDVDSGSTPSLLTSPTVLTPVRMRFVWSMSVGTYLRLLTDWLAILYLWVRWRPLHPSTAVPSSQGGRFGGCSHRRADHLQSPRAMRNPFGERIARHIQWPFGEGRSYVRRKSDFNLH